jgi:hypothetical protein
VFWLKTQAEEAAAKEKEAKGKKKKPKKGEPVEEELAPPTAEEAMALKAQEENSKVIAAIEDEAHACVCAEDERYTFRINLIKQKVLVEIEAMWVDVNSLWS